MEELINFVEEYFHWEIDNYPDLEIDIANQNLSLHEKILLYKYTEDAYEYLNVNLRDGIGNSMILEYERHLNTVLSKLPDYAQVVYRGIYLNETQIQRYTDAFQNNQDIQEDSFISTSKSRTTATELTGGNTLFRIISHHGKNIEQFSYHGSNSADNEEEILFASKTQFRILAVTNEDDLTLITMEEL